MVWIRVRAIVRVSINCISAIKTFIFVMKTSINCCSNSNRLLQMASTTVYEKENCLADAIRVTVLTDK